MNYLIQIIIIAISFYAAGRGKKEAKRALQSGVVDWGIYKLSPLQGVRAVKIAKTSLVISQTGPWILIVFIFLYDFIDKIR